MEKQSIVCTNPLGMHKMIYWDYAPSSSINVTNKVVFCLHGLSRNSKDFIPLATHLASKGIRVIVPDIVGRGESDYLHKHSLYNFPQYCSDLNALYHHIGASKISIVGTSMGGLIGMCMAFHNYSYVDKLVLNDIGPYLTRWELIRFFMRIPAAIPPQNKMLDTAIAKTRPFFAPNSEDEVRKFALNTLKMNEAGNYELNFDPKICEYPWYTRLFGMKFDMWHIWKQLQCPIYLVRGGKSILVSRRLADEMKQTQPSLQERCFDNIGHAPSLSTTEQMELIEHWLCN